MTIPKKLQVDFSPFEIDLIADALALLPMRYAGSCVLHQFIAAFVTEVQELYDAILSMQAGRTLYAAQGANLDGIGQIVGETRTPFRYSDTTWFAFDRAGQAFDSVPFWCIGAPLAEYLPVQDSQYQRNILLKILKNHTLIASPFELAYQNEFANGLPISFEKTGPMDVRLIVPAEISMTDLINYTVSENTRFVDDRYAVPYPSTLSISGYVVYAPNKFFGFDRLNDHQFDAGHFGVAASLPQ